jgi:2-desacetyl-2-hydroxyethyl bacteriochlorophyllide A dehydrogenase
VPLVVALAAPHQVVLEDVPSRALEPSEVRIRTLYSGVSAGTEMAFYRGTNPYLAKRWDPRSRLFMTGAAQTARYPVTTWGYEEVGEITETGSSVVDVAMGDRVYGMWGHRAEHIAPAQFARDRILPKDAEPLIGTFSHIGPIALNGVLDAHARLGETVAVFGLGVVGQLVAQLLAHNGARVIGVDLIASRRDTLARMSGAETLDPTALDPAEEIKRHTDGRGADVCVEASGSTRALHAAIRACAYSSRVVALGFYQGEANGLFLGEEFHHNRIQLVCSQIGGIAPDLQDRWDRARLVRTFMQLALSGAVQPTQLITHTVPAREAASLFATIDLDPASVLQAVLDFRGA